MKRDNKRDGDSSISDICKIEGYERVAARRAGRAKIEKFQRSRRIIFEMSNRLKCSGGSNRAGVEVGLSKWLRGARARGGPGVLASPPRPPPVME